MIETFLPNVLTNLSIGAVSAYVLGQVEHYEFMTKVLKDDGLCTAMQRPASYSSSKVSHKSPDTLAAAARVPSAAAAPTGGCSFWHGYDLRARRNHKQRERERQADCRHARWDLACVNGPVA